MSAPASTSGSAQSLAQVGARLLRWALLAGAAGVLLGAALHLVFQGAPAPAEPVLPTFHGQAQWAARERPAPSFVLRDQAGRLLSVPGRGRPVVLVFLSTRGGGSSAPEGVALGQTLALLAPAERPVVDVVSVDPAVDTPARERAAAAGWGLSGGGPYHWLSGPIGPLGQAWRDYAVTAVGSDRLSDPRVYLIDRRGYERAGYLYPFYPTVLAHDLRTLVDGSSLARALSRARRSRQRGSGGGSAAPGGT